MAVLELAKSTVSFTWAMALMGAKQLAEVVTGKPEAADRTRAAFDASTQGAGRNLGELAAGVYLAGDDLQRELTDLAFGFLRPGTNGASIARNASDTLRSLNPGQDGPLTLRELRNKLEVFQLVYAIRSRLDLPDAPPYPRLSASVVAAYDLGEYPALWAVEGLGHYHGETACERDEEPRGILAESVTGELPERALLMLHAGVGMAIARHWLRSVNHLSPTAAIRRVLVRILDLCRSCSRPGYEGAALESLGLIARNGQFYGETRPTEMVARIDRELNALDTDALDYFWHGVGRATYFLPIHFLPGYGSVWHALRTIRAEAGSERARQGALSGLAWAVTMVNIRHPGVLTLLLQRLDTTAADRAAFENGVASSLIMRQATTPGAPFIRSFYESVPGGAGAVATDRWPTWVRTPAERALLIWQPAIRESGALGEIFRCQSLSRLAGDREPAGGR